MKQSSPLIFFLAALLILTATAVSAPPIPANYLMCLPSPQLQNEEQIFVHPIDSLVVLANWRDFRLGYRQVGIGRSGDGGNTWTDGLINPVLLKYTRQSDPTMAVDNDGNFYVCVLDYQPIAADDSSYITFIKSTDKGLSWTGPYTVEDSIGPYFEDKQYITVDRSSSSPYEGNVYVAWARFPNPNRIMFARSTDGAMNWDDTLIVGPNQDFSYCGGSTSQDAGQFAFPFVGSDGAIYVAWAGYALDSNLCAIYETIKLVKSTDGGQTFTTERNILTTHINWGIVDGFVNVYASPMCAADISGGPFDGNLYIAYSSVDTNNPGEDRNIEFSRSTDGGDTWSEPIYVNDDFTGPGAVNDQFHVWMICNEEGTLISIWYDQRTDPSHYNFDVFAAYSFDGGSSWTTNHRISDVSINPDFAKDGGGQPAVYEDFDPKITPPPVPRMNSVSRAGLFGEYTGVTAFKDHVNACWTDTRGNNQNVYGANWVIPLMAPRLIYPSDGAVVPADFTFNWATMWKLNDDEYDFEVATDDQFTNIVLSSTPTESEFIPTSSLADGTYYWRVKARKISNAEESDWSQVYQFTVSSYIPAIPDPVSPPELDTVYNTAMPTFIWNQPDIPPDPITYNLEISEDISFTAPTVYIGISTTLYTVPDVFAEGHYYWRVEALNQFEQSQGYSDIFQFEQISFVCGDADNDDKVDLLDILYLIDYKFKNGAPPDLLIACDVNSDDKVDLLDILYLIDYKFKQGPAPDCPA